MTPKERLGELAKQLREAAVLLDPAARAAVELVKLVGDEARERLVDADGDDMLRLQGAVRQLPKLHRELTVTPPTIQEQQTHG